jgi:hypothetical protein
VARRRGHARSARLASGSLSKLDSCLSKSGSNQFIRRTQDNLKGGGDELNPGSTNSWYPLANSLNSSSVIRLNAGLMPIGGRAQITESSRNPNYLNAFTSPSYSKFQSSISGIKRANLRGGVRV